MTEHETPPPQPDDAAGHTVPPPPSQRPLQRRTRHRHLAGVAGGLADYLGVDPTIVRVAFVLLTIFGGSGLLLYLVGWVAIPTQSGRPSHLERWFGNAPKPVPLIAIAVGVVVLLASFDHGGGPAGGGGVGWGLLLLFGGWLLFRADNRAVGAATAAPVTDEAPGSAAGGWHGAGGGAAAAEPLRPPATPRPRSILGRLTVGVMLAAVGVAALLEQLGALDLEPVQYAALAMTITGAGLILGAWMGRAYGLIAVGVILVPVMLITSLAPLPLRGGAGEYRYRPLSLAALEDEYALGVGQMELDLSDLQLAGASTHVAVSVGVGEAQIIVPDDVTVGVDGVLRVGHMELFGTTTIGRPFIGDINAVNEGGGPGRLQLTIDNGIGELIIRRAGEES